MVLVNYSLQGKLCCWEVWGYKKSPLKKRGLLVIYNPMYFTIFFMELTTPVWVVKIKNC